jgi:phospholipase A2
VISLALKFPTDRLAPSQVLAIHPDYLLRQEILHKLRDRWLPLRPAGWHNVVVGLIRERQYELAMDTLERMKAQDIEVNDWLYGLLIYNLCDAEEFDEVLNVMRSRISNGYQLSPNLWFHVLDTASEALHEGATNYVWKQRVEPGFLNPSYGVCNNVLTITSRTGNTELATSVFRILGERKTSFVLSDFEALIDTYVMAGDVDSAFRILCMVNKTNVELEETSTRSILTHMIQTKMEPRVAWQSVKRLQTEEKRDIPIAAANVIIELCAHTQAINEAMDMYKELHIVCSGGPETTTFNHLFNACRNAHRQDICTFLIQEMILLKVLPDRMTYENLILFCVDSERYKEAYKYLVEMTETGFSLREAARKHVRTKCYDSDDSYAKQLQYDAGVRKPISTRLKEARQEPAMGGGQTGSKA